MTTARRPTNNPELLLENGRLRGELEAMRELVRLMAGEGDPQAALEAVTLLTGRLLGTVRTSIHLLDGDRLAFKTGTFEVDGQPYLVSVDRRGGGLRRRLASATLEHPWEPVPPMPRMAREIAGEPLDPGWVAARAVLDRRTMIVSDLFGPEGDAFPVSRETSGSVRARGLPGYAAVLSTPLLRGGHSLGSLSVFELTPRRFTADETALLETFAAQAAMAIENARLLADLQERLEEQSATGRVLEVISRSPTDLQTVLDTISESATRLCDTERSALSLVQGDGVSAVSVGSLVPEAGRRPSLSSPGMRYALTRTDSYLSRAIVDRAVVHVTDLEAVPVEEMRAVRGRQYGFRSVLSVPLLRGEAAIGAITLQRREVRPFTDRQIAVMRTFADQAVIAIENARLFQELNETNTSLTDALAQQTAMAEVLRAISQSPTNLRRVLETIAESAARICGSTDAGVFRVEGDLLRPVAFHGSIGATSPREAFPITRGSVNGRAVLERDSVHVPDVEELDPAEWQQTIAMYRHYGNRAALATPLLSEGVAVGTLMLLRIEPGPFSDAQIRLMETFADQAVIAIENARLFAELEESNRTLNEALEQQTATAEVLQTISRSAFDLQAVLQTLIDSAVRLCLADMGLIWRIDGEVFESVAVSPYDPAVRPWRGTLTEGVRTSTIFGRVAHERRVVHWEDVQADETLNPGVHAATRRSGARGFMSVPMFRGEELVGVLDLARRTVGAFTARQEALARTFGDQAVIAIENARLLGELRERDERRRQELERAATIQQRLLPSSVDGWPGVLEIACRFRPAVETSGDFYDVLPLPAARRGDLEPLQIAVGDVAGKGMSAALVTALARSALRVTTTIPATHASPALTLRLAGQRLHEDVGSSHFVACALAVVEPPGLLHAGPRLRVSNAAQVPVLLVRAGSVSELEAAGDRLPLGARPDGDYKDAEVELRPGDVVVFSSDGLVEAPALLGASVGQHLPVPGQAGELFGFARLAASASHWAARGDTAEVVAEGMWADLTAWCGDESHHDDMTLLVLMVTHTKKEILK